MSACVVCAPPLTADCMTVYTQNMTKTAAKPTTTADLHELGTEYLRLRTATEAAHVALREAIVAAAKTTSELQIAKATGVTRQTVRKALGK